MTLRLNVFGPVQKKGSSLDKIFLGVHDSMWLQKTCRSRRVAGNHCELTKIRSSFGGAYIFKFLGCPHCISKPIFSLSPTHTDGRATLLGYEFSGF